MDAHPGVPDPLEGDDPRPADDGIGERPGTGGIFDEDGPSFAWLPPEDRLWRHPSEGVPGRHLPGPEGPVSMTAADRRWGAVLPRSVLRSTWAVALIAGLVGATAATGVGMASGLWPHETTVIRSMVPSTSAVSLADIGAAPTNWTAVDDAVAPSVVTISVDSAAGPEMASGLVFLQSGGGRAYIVTDRSVFARGEAAGYIGSINVTFLSGAASRAKLVGEDRLSGLAVLQLTGADGAVPASLGTVSGLREADQVLAVGSRTGPSVSTGSVSGEDRTVALADGTDIDGLLAVSMPQLSSTAAGGPLLDQFGRVVAVTLSLNPAGGADQQFTYGVPIDEVSRVATEIIDGVSPSHPWLGIGDADDVPSTTAHQLGINGGVQAGVVSPSSPAGQVGIRTRDVITELDGQPVFSAGALIAKVNACTPGRSVPVTYIHAGRTIRTAVRIGEEPLDG